ncbi:MAG: HAMP domain-containing sensor histidine kinase, partial [Bacteroidota bacterium]
LQGDFQAALHNYHLYMEAKESMKGMNEDETITELRIKFETERRERENELLKRDQELKEAQLAAQKTTIRNQRYLALGAILGFLMLLSLAFALYRSNRNIKEANFALSASKEEIKQKKEELEGLNQTKDKWFAMICHDFKQPLAFMQGALSLLNTSELSVSERNMILHEMESRVRSASLLLDNLLLWAQDQLSGIIVRTEKIDMAQMIAESLILLDPIASKGQIEISKSFQQGQHVWADPTMIQLVLNNLLTSAIKLTHAGEEVRISTELKDGMLITHIADSGQAIPEEYLSKMFNFDHHRLIEGIAREQGMGISLLISKDFIEKNGGKIWVKTYQNRGNIFSFSLPSGDKPMPSSKQSNPMLPREPIQV